MHREILTPDWTGQTASDSYLKWETDYPLNAFFWLSRESKIWVTCWKYSIGGIGWE